MVGKRTIRPMVPRTDEKIHRLGTLLGPGWSANDLTTLCRLGDATKAPPGTMLQQEDGFTRWCYWILNGSAVVSRDGEPLMICGPGTLLPGGANTRRRRAPASVEALEDL